MKYIMMKSKRLRWVLGMAVVCLFMLGLSSCGTSRQMGCPMQFRQSVVYPSLLSSPTMLSNQPALFKPLALCIAS